MEVNVTPLPLDSRKITPLTNEERGGGTSESVWMFWW